MIIDSHCHLDFPEFDCQATMARCARAGVGRIVIPAVAAWNWQRIADLCAQDSRLYPAYGLHPLYLAAHEKAHIAALESWLGEHAAVAVGECGLDYFVDLPRDKQQWFFEAQLDVAQRCGLPVIIHARRALEAVLQTMRHFPGLRFVVHSFTGSDAQLARLLALGGIVGIGGTCTYPRAARLRRQIAGLRPGQYMLETDAPDQPLYGRQGEMNEPWLSALVGEEVARLTSADAADVAAWTTQTAEDFFHFAAFPRQ